MEIFFAMMFTIIILIIIIIHLINKIKTSKEDKQIETVKQDFKAKPKRFKVVHARRVDGLKYYVICSIKIKGDGISSHNESAPEITYAVKIPVEIESSSYREYQMHNCLERVLADIAKSSYQYISEKKNLINDYERKYCRSVTEECEFYIDETEPKESYEICECLEEIQYDDYIK